MSSKEILLAQIAATIAAALIAPDRDVLTWANDAASAEWRERIADTSVELAKRILERVQS